MTDSHQPLRCPGPAGMVPTRRDFLRSAGGGFGLLGLSSLLQKEGFALGGEVPPSKNPMAARAGHFAPKAKRCIFLFMTGGPSQVWTCTTPSRT